MNEVIEKLKEELPEEMEGVEEYYHLALKAKEIDGHCEAAKKLLCIALDEYTHALFIYEVMQVHGVDTAPFEEKYNHMLQVAHEAFNK